MTGSAEVRPPRSRQEAVIQRVSRSRGFARVAPSLLPRLDRAVHRLSGGRAMISQHLLPSLFLSTTGRRSGQPRVSPLACLPEPDGALLVIGSNFGQSRHPAWTGKTYWPPPLRWSSGEGGRCRSPRGCRQARSGRPPGRRCCGCGRRTPSTSPESSASCESSDYCRQKLPTEPVPPTTEPPPPAARPPTATPPPAEPAPTAEPGPPAVLPPAAEPPPAGGKSDGRPAPMRGRAAHGRIRGRFAAPCEVLRAGGHRTRARRSNRCTSPEAQPVLQPGRTGDRVRPCLSTLAAERRLPMLVESPGSLEPPGASRRMPRGGPERPGPAQEYPVLVGAGQPAGTAPWPSATSAASSRSCPDRPAAPGWA
jgi:hypothetical protein